MIGLNHILTQEPCWLAEEVIFFAHGFDDAVSPAEDGVGTYAIVEG
jgi:hypothetical protein